MASKGANVTALGAHSSEGARRIRSTGTAKMVAIATSQAISTHRPNGNLAGKL
jgi:hypothetical protein